MSLDTNRIQALCFDIDGTLSDTDDQYVHKLAGWLNPFRSLLRDKDALSTARRVITSVETPGNRLLEFLDRLGIDDELGRLADLITRHTQIHQPDRHLTIPGVMDMLEALQPHFQMSIVSSRRHSNALFVLDGLNMKHFFPVIATAQTCRYSKPYPDPVRWAALQMGVEPQACLMVGDTVVDILAGKAAGAQTVGVLCGFGTQDELDQAGADLIIDNTSQLTDALGL